MSSSNTEKNHTDAANVIAADPDTRFRTLFEQAPFSMQLLTADGRTAQVNRAWEVLWGTENIPAMKEYVLTEYNVLKDPQLEAKGVLAYLRKAFAGESTELPVIYYHPAELNLPGRGRWVGAWAHPIKDDEGRVLEVMLVHQDVTERVESQSAIQASEMRLRVAAEAGNIGTWEWDIAKDTILWSDRVYALHGVEPSNFTVDMNSFASLVHPDDRADLWRRIEISLTQPVGFSAEFRAVWPDGTIKWLSTWAKVEADPGGKPSRMIGATISIDAHKKAEEVLLETNRRKDEFLAMLAHELRNPLAPISAAADILKLPALDAQRIQKTSEVLSRQVEHMRKLIDELMDVSRVTRGLVKLDKENLDLKAVIGLAIEQVRSLIETRQHVLRTRMDADHLRVAGDRTRLVQILSNLLNNAAKYTPMQGEIAVDVSVVGGKVRIAVMDNGQGIEPALLPYVFELFTQGKRQLDRSQGGLGIGLALVKSIVALHEGEVEARSEGIGKGSVFTITLPLADAVEASRLPAEEDAPSSSDALHIVVVDDNLDAAHSLAILLEAAGHRVTIFENATRALRESANMNPKVFILDIGLPDMTGYELAQRLRGNETLKHAMLVALTGYGQQRDRELSCEAGFDHHFVKPVETKQLFDILSRVRSESGAAG